MRVVLVIVLGFLWACEPSNEATSLDRDPSVLRDSLRRGNGGEPGSLDPALASDIHAFNVLTDVFEGLLATDAGGGLVGGVAESWQVRDGGRILDFQLRADARWSNGDPVTAHDFVRSFRRIAKADTPAPLGFLLEPIEHFVAIKRGERPADELGIVATGAHGLRIRLARPTPWFLSVLSMPVASPAHESTAAGINAVSGNPLFSNGAYILDTASAGGVIRLMRNPYYWDAESVNIGQVEYFPITNESTELNMYRTGELDLTHSIPPGHLSRLREERPEEVRISPLLALYYLAFDLTEAPFSSREVRQALSMAIDREKLVEIIGRGEIAAYGIVPPGVAAYSGPEYAWRNLSNGERARRAEALLAEAGFSAAAPLRLTYSYDAGSIHEQVALAVGAMWSDTLNVEVEYDKREWNYYLQTRGVREEWQIMRFAWFGDYDDATTFLDIFRANSTQNLPGYSSADYDALLNAASDASDLNERKRRLASAERLLLEDYPIAPLYYFVSKRLLNPQISGYQDNVLDKHPSRYLSFRKPKRFSAISSPK